MKQGRKSKYTTMAALRSALTVLAAIALIAPAAALGQAAAGEYDDANLPQASDNYQIPGADEQSAGGAVSPTSQGDDGPGTGAGSGSGGGGGATILLIALALVAAGCVGVAAWRLRRGGSDISRSSETPPPITPGTTGESRTL